MRFYYWSFLNWIPITIFYLIAAVVLWILWRLIKDDKNAKYLMFGLIPVMLILPCTEELWIAWKFGQLCKKDAGIAIYKTVEVDGFYDATRSTHADSPTPQAIEEYERSGYRYYERRFRDTGKIVHIEKVNGVWTPTILDRPTARYRYAMTHMDTPMGHGVEKIERVVDDRQTRDVLARETKYKRKAPWYFVGLDRPVMLCPAPGEHPLSQYGSVFNLALKPR
jgi:hypothetical protein